MNNVPDVPPMIAPTRSPAPPTTIIAVLVDLDSDDERTTATRDRSVVAGTSALVHDSRGETERSMATGITVAESDVVDPMDTVDTTDDDVSGTAVELWAMSGAARNNRAI